MAQSERVFIVIGGSNFYHRLKELGLVGLLDFDIGGLAADLLLGNRQLFRKKYYIGAIRARRSDAKEQKLRQNQQKLFAKLEHGGWEIGLGFLLESDGIFHEKGVDAQMATDMLIGAYENLYDAVMLISSDTDLIPAIIKVRELNKKIISDA